jgi:succinyl-CoA synthetase beta subunit
MLCRRHLSLHEHLSMGILSKYGVTVPRGEMAITPEQAKDVADRFGTRSHKIIPVSYPQTRTVYACT